MRRRNFLLASLAGTALAGLPRLPARAASEDNAAVMTDMVLGEADAPVTIEAFESLVCPHCATFHRETLHQLKEQYIDTGQVRFVFRDFPPNRTALQAHLLARCAGPDAFFGMIEVMFRSQQTWSRASDPVEELRRIGRMSGIGSDEFDACMANTELQDYIIERIAQGIDDYGVRSTPTFVVNGEPLIIGAQPFEEFDRVLGPLTD